MFRLPKILKETMLAFPNSFINKNNELILVPATNTYFNLSDIDSELIFKCKILEWCSRDACKSQPYKANYKNSLFHETVRNHINIALDTNFTEEDMFIIYDMLGNCVNRKLSISFIESGYDMNVLKEQSDE